MKKCIHEDLSKDPAKINKWEEGKHFAYSRILITKCRGHEGVRKLLLGNHHSNKCFRQESSMSVKAST
jgi:hypothetical protein